MSFEIETINVGNTKVVKIPGDDQGKHVLLLHGYGANAQNLAVLSGVYRRRPRPTWYFPEGPISVPISEGVEGRAWFPIDMSRLEDATKQNTVHLEEIFPYGWSNAKATVQEIIQSLDIPIADLIIGGFSQGAILALETLFDFYTQPLGAVILSGGLINEGEWQAKAANFQGLPFFQSHGTTDPVLPFSQAKKLERLLLQAGWIGKLFEFQGGHDITQTILVILHQFCVAILDRES